MYEIFNTIPCNRSFSSLTAYCHQIHLGEWFKQTFRSIFRYYEIFVIFHSHLLRLTETFRLIIICPEHVTAYNRWLSILNFTYSFNALLMLCKIRLVSAVLIFAIDIIRLALTRAHREKEYKISVTSRYFIYKNYRNNIHF